MNSMIHILFLVRSLETGGAQRQLIELVKGIDKSDFTVTVATFYDGGALRPDIDGLSDVTLISLHKKGRWDLLPFLWRLVCLVHEVKPQIVHGYMGIANELGLLMAKMVGARAVWGLRASNMDFSRYDWASAWGFRIGAWASHFADLIIVNSHAGQQYHIAHNYAGDRMIVISNGIESERFRPDCTARQRLRCEWSVGENERLIGLVGRLDPMKDHPTFLRAAALLHQERQDVRFVCVGDGPAPYKQELQSLAREFGLGEYLIWASARSDMPCIYNALDIATSSSSYGEGFANVIGEAMSCGIPCVATDVGDSAAIVGDQAQIVPPRDPRALMGAWIRFLDLSEERRVAIAEQARKRIVNEYSIQQFVRNTEATLLGISS
jgi:glycosyltransferase involved in cell wall biosynthesis